MPDKFFTNSEKLENRERGRTEEEKGSQTRTGVQGRRGRKIEAIYGESSA